MNFNGRRNNLCESWSLDIAEIQPEIAEAVRFRFRFIELVARRLAKNKKKSKQTIVHCTIKQYNTHECNAVR